MILRQKTELALILKFSMLTWLGAPFKKFSSLREQWAVKNQYISPGILP